MSAVRGCAQICLVGLVLAFVTLCPQLAAAGDDRGSAGATGDATSPERPSIAARWLRAARQLCEALDEPARLTWETARAPYDPVAAHLLCGDVWLRKKNFDQAITCYSEAIKLAPA